MQVISISEIVSQFMQRRNGKIFISEFINQCEWIDAIPLEKIKQAKEEIENISDTVHDGENHYYKDCKETKKECLSIIDKLIAESEGVNDN